MDESSRPRDSRLLDYHGTIGRAATFRYSPSPITLVLDARWHARCPNETRTDCRDDSELRLFPRYSRCLRRFLDSSTERPMPNFIPGRFQADKLPRMRVAARCYLSTADACDSFVLDARRHARCPNEAHTDYRDRTELRLFISSSLWPFVTIPRPYTRCRRLFQADPRWTSHHEPE